MSHKAHELGKFLHTYRNSLKIVYAYSGIGLLILHLSYYEYSNNW